MRRTIIACALTFAVSAFGANKKVEQTRPNSGNAERGKLASRHSLRNHRPSEIQRDGASYIAPHFAKLHLEIGDSLMLAPIPSGSSGPVVYTGPLDRSNRWGRPVAGSRVKLTLTNLSGRASFDISEFAAGFDFTDLRTKNVNSGKGGLVQNCGPDDSEPAVCFRTTQPVAYRASNAVVRLIIHGSTGCTGWLVGDQGHILTNQHCIADQSDADDTVVELGAEGSECADQCDFFQACQGKQFIEGAKFVDADADLDYALIKVKDDISAFGFLRIRRDGPADGEPIYIPQHEHGWGKRIAFVSTFDVVKGAVAAHDPTISSLKNVSCSSGLPSDAGYFADTEHGSSGSPILARGDDLVVALHHCGGCLNTATPINLIVPKIEGSIPKMAIVP